MDLYLSLSSHSTADPTVFPNVSGAVSGANVLPSDLLTDSQISEKLIQWFERNDPLEARIRKVSLLAH